MWNPDRIDEWVVVVGVLPRRGVPVRKMKPHFNSFENQIETLEPATKRFPRHLICILLDTTGSMICKMISAQSTFDHRISTWCCSALCWCVEDVSVYINACMGSIYRDTTPQSSFFFFFSLSFLLLFSLYTHPNYARMHGCMNIVPSLAVCNNL